MCEMGNRAEFGGETMLQFTQVLIKKRQMAEWAVEEGPLLGPKPGHSTDYLEDF